MSDKRVVKISKPCPMSLSKMTSFDGTFYCKSCSKDVTDFRGLSANELKNQVFDNVCGVFDEEQVQPIRFSRYKKTIFSVLTLVSLLGFSVNPVNAKDVQLQSGIENQLSIADADGEKKKKKKRKKRWNPFKKKKKVFNPVGCPSF